jgi:hypothetical protein
MAEKKRRSEEEEEPTVDVNVADPHDPPVYKTFPAEPSFTDYLTEGFLPTNASAELKAVRKRRKEALGK